MADSKTSRAKAWFARAVDLLSSGAPYTPAQLGRAYFRMLVNDQWVHRQVDSLRIDTDGYSRRHVSLDITVPHDALPWPNSDSRQVSAPIGVLEKRVLQNFDVSLDGSPVPVLTRQQNGAVSRAFLGYLLRNIHLPSDHESELEKEIGKVVDYDGRDRDDGTPPSSIESALRRAFSAVENLTPDAATSARLLTTYVDLLTNNFLFSVVLPADLRGKRIVVKYSFDQRLDVKGTLVAPSLLTFSYVAPQAWSSASYHVEFDLPPSLAIVAVTSVKHDLRESPIHQGNYNGEAVADGFGADPPGRSAGSDPESAHEEQTSSITNAPELGSPRSHVALRPPGDIQLQELRAGTIPIAQGIRTFTNWTTVVVVLLVLLSIPIRMWNIGVALPFTAPSPVAPVILIGPALFLSWLSRSREHDIVSRLLLPLRCVLICCAAILLLLAVLAAVPMQVWLWHVMWIVIYLLTSIVALVAWRVRRTYSAYSPTPDVD